MEKEEAAEAGFRLGPVKVTDQPAGAGNGRMPRGTTAAAA
jgi:hypothetical protein